MKVQFFCPMSPPTATAQERQVTVIRGKPLFYEPPRVAEARSKLTAALGEHRPSMPLRGPVRLIVKWCFPLAGDHSDGEYKATRPDTDNLQKLLKDCMTSLGFWRDDAQVAAEYVEKFWAEMPGIWVMAEELT